MAGIAISGRAGAVFQPFTRSALRLLLILVVIPNAVFLAAMPFYIAERLIAPLFYLAAGLLSLVLPRWTAYILLPIAAALDFSIILIAAFGLPLGMALDSIPFIATIDPAASSLYIIVVSAMAASAFLAARLTVRFRTELRTASPTPAAAVALLLMLLDWQANFPYVQSRIPNTKFESAVAKAGLDAETVAADGNNLLVVLVEGMGAFASPQDRAVLTEPLEAVAARLPYRFESGTSRYYGSTTGAESRELCGRWGDHRDYLVKAEYDCLPRRLAALGYETIAYHGYTSSMFDRATWYPHIGFTLSHFKEDMSREQATLVPSRCGSVFDGLCDTEVAEVVRRELTQPSERPKMVYWLTLNSHIPFVPQSKGRLGCASATPVLDNRTVCGLTEYWADVMHDIAEIAADPALPPTDILIVGDHHTPLWDRAAKNKFLLNKVDWFLLRRDSTSGN